MACHHANRVCSEYEINNFTFNRIFCFKGFNLNEKHDVIYIKKDLDSIHSMRTWKLLWM